MAVAPTPPANSLAVAAAAARSPLLPPPLMSAWPAAEEQQQRVRAATVSPAARPAPDHEQVGVRGAGGVSGN